MQQITPSRWQKLRRAFSMWADGDSALRVAAPEDASDLPTRTLTPLQGSDRRDFAVLLRHYESNDPLLDWTPSGEPQPFKPLFSEGQLLAGRFRIVQLLGRGGMGEVYEAINTTLDDSRVALKTLSSELRERPEATRRFLREVELAQRVTHPNICRIHDIYPFTHTDPGGAEMQGYFLTMHLLKGETLAQFIARRGSLSLSEALPLLRSMAEALHAAHSVGVVHRDFKPGNVILIERRGELQPVITDFGLAALSGRTSDTASEDLSRYTRAGTPEYAAPEQIVEGQSGPSSDIYSLGVVALEMLTGQTIDPQTRNLNPSARAAIGRCLSPDPTARFSSAPEFVAALAGEKLPLANDKRLLTRRNMLAASAACTAAAAVSYFEWRRWFEPSLRSVAILQFDAISPQAAMPGFQLELIRSLLQSGKIHIIAPYSAASIQPPFDFAKLQQQTGAAGFLTGRIVQNAIDLELRSPSGHRLWSKSFARTGSDFSLQQKIQAALVEQIAGPAASVSPPSYVPNEAGYRAYVAARAAIKNQKTDHLAEAESLFREAIRHDSGYPPIFSGLAYTLFLMDRMSEARAAAKRALELDPNSAEASLVNGYILYRGDWNWPDAQRAFRRALDLEPFNPATHQAYGGFLADQGAFTEALGELKTAVDSDPLSYLTKVAYGIRLVHARLFDAAIPELQTTLDLARAANAEFARPYVYLGAAWLMKGDKRKAYAYYAAALSKEKDNPQIVAHYVWGAAQSGHTAAAESYLQRLLQMSAAKHFTFFTGLAFAGLGDCTRALDYLERAVELHDGDVVEMKTHLYLDPVRSEPRYKALLARLKLT